MFWSITQEQLYKIILSRTRILLIKKCQSLHISKGSVKQKSAKSNANPSRTSLLADHLIGKKALTLYTNLLETAIFIATPMKNNILQFILVVFFFCQFVDIKLVVSSMLKYSLLVGDTNKFLKIWFFFIAR